MTFSLISVAVLLIAALVITIEVVRAINRGFQKTLVSLASLFVTVFVSMIVTRFLSGLLAKYMLSFITSVINVSETADKLPSTENILLAYADSFVAPLLFLVVFILVRIIVAIVIKIVFNIREKNSDLTQYESEDAPEYKKNPTLTNGLLGALCGFIVVVVAISPIMGSVKITAKAFKGVNEDSDLFSVRIKSNIVEYFDKCSNDIAGNIFYYSGGNLVYRAVAASKLNDNYFGLKREIDNTFATAGNLLSMGEVLDNISAATPEEKAMLKNLGKDVDKAETLKSATADILPVVAKKWLNNEPYEGRNKPKVSKACESFFNKMLYVCKSTTPETAGDDLSTLLNVYIIAYENGILISENYKEMIEKAKYNGAFDLIKDELNKNPRMAGISLDIDTMGVKSIASAIQSFNVENYDTLMTDITAVLNNAIALNGQNRLDYVTDLTTQYIKNYGIDVGNDVAGEVAQRLVDELVDHRSSVTVDDLKEFWDKYSVKIKSETNTDVNIPSIDENLTQENPDFSLDDFFDESGDEFTDDEFAEDEGLYGEDNYDENFDESYSKTEPLPDFSL